MKMTARNRNGVKPPRKQTGVALAVSLILLVVVTLLALTTLQSVTLEEKMAGATFDRQLSFQAAETALRQGEQYANANKPILNHSDEDNTCPSNAINNCSNGACPPPDKDCPPRWDPASGFNQWKDASVTHSLLTGSPQYFIEFLSQNADCTDGGQSDPKNCKLYRITARSFAIAGQSSVILQSIYRTE